MIFLTIPGRYDFDGSFSTLLRAEWEPIEVRPFLFQYVCIVITWGKPNLERFDGTTNKMWKSAKIEVLPAA